MSDDKDSSATASTVVYQCSNKSLMNTIITSPDGTTSYIIETPCKHMQARTTTVFIQNASKNETLGSSREVVATIGWRIFHADMLTFQGQEPVAVKDYLPKKWYTWYANWLVSRCRLRESYHLIGTSPQCMARPDHKSPRLRSSLAW